MSVYSIQQKRHETIALKQTEKFRRVAVRIALSGGLSRTRGAADMGIGKSTLSRWILRYRSTDLTTPAAQTDLVRENERLRLENRVLQEEREILKKAPVLREPKDVRFAFIRAHRDRWSIADLCRFLQVLTYGC